VIGTPAYMAPEQHMGGIAGPAADQFAFCASLWRALFGALPFVGDTPRELARAKRSGRVASPPGPSAVPSWLEQVVRRGLAPHPHDRWPSMQHLIAALERRPRRTAMRRLASATIIAGVIGFALPTDAAPREGAAPPAEQRVERIAPRLDALVRSWRTAKPPNSRS
jgi:serine/threonine protein kinase